MYTAGHGGGICCWIIQHFFEYENTHCITFAAENLFKFNINITIEGQALCEVKHTN